MNDPAYLDLAPPPPRRNPWIIIGIIYSSLSALALIPLILIQFFSIFLFDSPNHQAIAIVIALGILLMPILLICGNGLMWLFIAKRRTPLAIACMVAPVIYPILFFMAWAGFSP